jgi:hypothetical protein
MLTGNIICDNGQGRNNAMQYSESEGMSLFDRRKEQVANQDQQTG